MSSRTQTVDMSSTTACAYKCKVPMLYVILRARANLPRRLFEGGVYFTQRLQLCGVYSRAASIRGRRLFAEIRYLSSAWPRSQAVRFSYDLGTRLNSLHNSGAL